MVCEITEIVSEDANKALKMLESYITGLNGRSVKSNGSSHDEPENPNTNIYFLNSTFVYTKIDSDRNTIELILQGSGQDLDGVKGMLQRLYKGITFTRRND